MKKNKKLNESIIHNLNEADEATLDKDILVYDINAFIDKEINPKQDVKYKAFDWDGGAAILIKQDGSGCIVDYEAIGTKFENTSKQVSVTICPEGEDDGNGHMSFYIMPTASFKATIDELMTAPSKPMKARDFFTKYNYNDRCERNFAGIEDYVINNVNTNSINEAANPENEEKNKIIRQALNGPKSYVKNLKSLQKMGINKGYREDPDVHPGEVIFLNGSNGKQLSVDPDGTSIWHTYGNGGEHYKKELSYQNRKSNHYTKRSTMDFKGDRAKAFDYYNYFNKPKNEYQDEVDKANEVKKYRDNEGKQGYNLPDEALTPEEKSLNKRTRKYMQLKKDRADLEDKLAGYQEDKNKLDQVNKDIKSLHNKKLKESNSDVDNKNLHKGVLNETVPFNVDIEDYLEQGGSYGWTVKPGSEEDVLDMLDMLLLNVDLIISEYFSEKYPETSDKCKGITEKLDSIRDDLRNLMK